MTDYAKPDALVSPEWAQQHLDDPGVRFVEVDVDTAAYEQRHLPGAGEVHRLLPGALR